MTAGGKLGGFIKLQYKDKTPMVDGLFQAETKGWIRYRPPGAETKNNHSIQRQSHGSPERIIFIDFTYDTLSVSDASDKNYDSIMILNTFGRNPQYVQGKPLKLNFKARAESIGRRSVNDVNI